MFDLVFFEQAGDYAEANRQMEIDKNLRRKPIMKKIRRGVSPESRTYKDWRLAGYTVVKGQKATSWTKDGVAKFDFEQVKPLNAGNYADGGWENIHNQSDLWDHPDFYDGWDNIGDKD